MNGFRILKLLIPDESRIIDSLSFPIVFNTNIDEINKANGNIWDRIFGITAKVRLKKTGILAPLTIASSSILRTWVNHAKDSIAMHTTIKDIASFFIIYLSILAIIVRLYTNIRKCYKMDT